MFYTTLFLVFVEGEIVLLGACLKPLEWWAPIWASMNTMKQPGIDDIAASYGVVDSFLWPMAPVKNLHPEMLNIIEHAVYVVSFYLCRNLMKCYKPIHKGKDHKSLML